MYNDIRDDQIVEMIRGFDVVQKLWKDFTDDEKKDMNNSGQWYLLADCEEADVLCVVAC